MKRIALVLSALALAAGISACGGGTTAGSGKCAASSADGMVIAVLTHGTITGFNPAPPQGCSELANLVITANFEGKPVNMPADPGNPFCVTGFGANGAEFTVDAKPGGETEAQSVCEAMQQVDANSNETFSWASGQAPAAPAAPAPSPSPSLTQAGTYDQGYAFAQQVMTNDPSGLTIPAGTTTAVGFCEWRDQVDLQANNLPFTDASLAAISGFPWVQGCAAAIHAHPGGWPS